MNQARAVNGVNLEFERYSWVEFSKWWVASRDFDIVSCVNRACRL